MIKKIVLEIDVPEYNWVDVPTQYRTPIGEFESIEQVLLIKDLIEYLQRLEDRFAIIQMDYRIRNALCREIVRERLRFIADENIYWYGEKLGHFLAEFDERRTGLNFDDYKFKHEVLSNGKKIQFKTFTRLFKTEDDAMKHIADLYLHNGKFKYTIPE